MDILVIHASPNRDGLTAACAAAASEGARQAGATVSEVPLNEQRVGLCRACERGYGTCRTEHECQELDGFQALHARIRAADGIVLVTPVYWGEMSESAKALTDRLRRCEATLAEASRLAGRPLIAVAAAGGTGNGTVTCLLSMERWAQHVRARVFDLIAVNRWTRPYKLETIRSAACAMVTEAVQGETA